ncbi:hypothetical protein, partial [Burkholderia ubonensis]|uniref:hypothetical protein n=1 Tax=Burkholderia ubonensis TaxID=101571 RepID=UPI000B035AF0
SMNQSGANYDISIWLSYDITTWFLQQATMRCVLRQMADVFRHHRRSVQQAANRRDRPILDRGHNVVGVERGQHPARKRTGVDPYGNRARKMAGAEIAAHVKALVGWPLGSKLH